ncbi:MAG: T9SS type A sorting domain-containing protein [Bacteroidales bacterium]
MKTLSSLLSFGIFVMAIVTANTVFSQKRTVNHDQSIQPKKKTENISKGRANNFSASDMFNAGKKYNADTLNYPLAGQYYIYYTDFGYVSGNNEYGDKAKANIFEYPGTGYVTGILFDFAAATNSNINIEIAIWDNTGTNNSPGNIIGSTTAPLDDIFIDVLNNQTTYIEFNPPVEVTSQFYAGVVLPQTSGDTIAVYSNTDGNTNPATAWEQWIDGSWYVYNDTLTWDLNVAHAIFPIVTSTVDLTANFSASPQVALPGQTIQFIDLSLGNPTSWLWTFDGGLPIQSNEENPQVSYTETGLYGVKLVVSDGVTSDSMVKANYIEIVEEIPPQIDTLLYPLPGIYTVYIINNNGGYVTGTNAYGDLAKANYFQLYQDLFITGILYDFAWASETNTNLELAVWDINEGYTPGSKIATMQIPLNTVKQNILNQDLTYFEINPPIAINHPFYVGFEIPQSFGDTIVVWSNEHMNTNPGIAWDKFKDGTWHPFNEVGNWELNVAMAIHPIVEYVTAVNENGINDLIEIYPNPSEGDFTLRIPVSVDDNYSVEIYSAKGVNISSEIYLMGLGQLNFNISRQAEGIYFVKIQSEERTFLKKIIKK